VDFVNQSSFPAAWTLGFEPDGRELLVVVVKATYSIPGNEAEPLPAAVQVPLTEADEFTGEPGYSAPLHESDYGHRKLACDVILNGSAYTPDGRPVSSVPVSLRVGSVRKSFWVFGDRKWDGGITIFPTDPEPFVTQRISYDYAYGGCDFDDEAPDKSSTYRANPIGVGFHPLRPTRQLKGKPLPTTSATSQAITDTEGKHRPLAFGPVGRNFDPRLRFAGTYDQEWLDHRAPFWPDDFSYRYFQAAPEDQQTVFLDGDEEVVLENLTAAGLTRFRIPRNPMPVIFIPYRGEDREAKAVCDTLVVEPDEGRFTLTWRTSLPLRQSCFEIRQVVVGEVSHSWRSARRASNRGKTYYRNLADLIAKQPAEPEEEAE